MRELISRCQALFTVKIGRCGRCIRQSFAAALASWGVFGIGFLMRQDGLVQDLIGLSAFGLTTLWALHIAAYAARAVAEARSGVAQLRGPVVTSVIALARTELGVEHLDRRRALGVFLRAAGVGMAASVPVLLWPADVLAFCGQCTKNEDCGVGFVCKNTAPVNSGKICNECA